MEYEIVKGHGNKSEICFTGSFDECLDYALVEFANMTHAEMQSMGVRFQPHQGE